MYKTYLRNAGAYIGRLIKFTQFSQRSWKIILYFVYEKNETERNYDLPRATPQ